MELRLATIEDFEVFNGMFVNFSNSEEYKTEPMIFERYQHLIDLEAIYFAIQDENVLGYAVVVAFEGYGAEITSFFVKEKRKKHGTEFYELIEKEVLSFGIDKISLIAFWDEAERFWTKMGYHSVDGTDKFVKMIQ